MSHEGVETSLLKVGLSDTSTHYTLLSGLLALPQLSVHPLQVPADAHIMDLVFNDGESSTFVDNNGGLDFHIPIEGGKGVMPGIKVCVWGGGKNGERSSSTTTLGGGGGFTYQLRVARGSWQASR